MVCGKNPWAVEALSAIDTLTQNIAAVSRLSDRLEFLLVEEPPYLSRDGGFIKSGAHAPLDELRALRDEIAPHHRGARR
jgi:DNA mismatch repair protein MutS